MRQPPQDLLPRHAQILATEGDLAGVVHVEELGAGILEHAAHLPCRVPQGLPGHVFAAHMHAAGQLPLEIVGDQTVDKPCHGGLTAAALAAQHRHLSLRDGQVNIPDAAGGGVRLIGKCHMAHKNTGENGHDGHHAELLDTDSEQHEGDASDQRPQCAEDGQEDGHKADGDGHAAAQHKVKYGEKTDINQIFCLKFLIHIVTSEAFWLVLANQQIL